jgi:hypothetical protein
MPLELLLKEITSLSYEERLLQPTQALMIFVEAFV